MGIKTQIAIAVVNATITLGLGIAGLILDHKKKFSAEKSTIDEYAKDKAKYDYMYANGLLKPDEAK